MSGQTTVAIEGEDFLINGERTYPGREWRGHRIEGLLMNSRMVQGIFDDLNPQTRSMWDYPDGEWGPGRNTREFIDAMPTWREHGLISFTINLQGGSPQGYSKQQPWHNSAFEADGALRPDYMARLEQILDKADELGMAPMLGYFYFGQDHRLADERAVLDATDHATDWLMEHGYRNVLVEINNECNVSYDHEVLKPHRVHELIERVTKHSEGALDTPAGRLLVSTSYGGNHVVEPNVARTADYILMHGNGVSEPDRIREMVREARQVDGYRGQPIVFNEDDHFDFDKLDNNMIAAVSEHAGWGYFDWRMPGEEYDDGYQSVPVNWGISSDRKRGFFNLLREMTGG